MGSMATNKIGIGLCTFNRPKYFDQSSKAIVKQILPYVDRLVIYNDGSTLDYKKSYAWLERLHSPKIKIIHSPYNKGVGKAKNVLFKELMKDCEYIFIAEDDIVPQDKRAIIHYMAANRMNGVEHMMFAHHGPENQQPDSLVDIDGPLEYYKASVGAWCFYTRNILKEVGLMDENFHNAWEHVEHTWRIFKHLKLPYGYYPDVIGSREFLKEIPGSIDNSSIGKPVTGERLDIIIEGLKYWKKKDKEFPAEHTLKHFEGVKNDLNTTTITK